MVLWETAQRGTGVNPDARIERRGKVQAHLYSKKQANIKTGQKGESGQTLFNLKKVRLRGKSPRQRVMQAEQMVGQQRQEHNWHSGRQTSKVGGYTAKEERRWAEEGHDHGRWRGCDRAGESASMWNDKWASGRLFDRLCDYNFCTVGE